MVTMMVNEQQYFLLHDGRVIKNLDELREFLRTMEQSLFDYHVTVERNDFANWIREVLQDIVLANNIQHALSPKEMVSIIDAKLADDLADIQRQNREKIRTAKFIFPIHNGKKRLIDEMKRIFTHA